MTDSKTIQGLIVFTAIVIIFVASLVTGVLLQEKEVLTHCGPGLHLNMDTMVCYLPSEVEPKIVYQEKIVEKIITESLPLNTDGDQVKEDFRK